MAKVSRKLAHVRFTALCDALGQRVATDYNDVGAWQLDYLAPHGYKIEEINSPTGGITHPFGTTRFKGREFYDLVSFTLRAIQIDRTNGTNDGQYWPTDKIQNPRQSEE